MFATVIRPVVVSIVIPLIVGVRLKVLVPVPRVAVKVSDVRAIPFVVMMSDPADTVTVSLINTVNCVAPVTPRRSVAVIVSIYVPGRVVESAVIIPVAGSNVIPAFDVGDMESVKESVPPVAEIAAVEP